MLSKLALALPAGSCGFTPYEVDPDWHIQGPKGAGRWTSSFVWGDKLVVGQKKAGPTPLDSNAGYAEPFLIFDKDSGAFLHSFGAEFAMIQSNTTEFGPDSCYGPYFSIEKLQLMPRDYIEALCQKEPQKFCGSSHDLMWVTDYDAHTVSIIGLEDLRLKQTLGRFGDQQEPNGPNGVRAAVPASQDAVDPAKFGNPAGVAFADGAAYIADGEDYEDQVNRLEAWSLNRSSGLAKDSSPGSVEWLLPEHPPSQRSVQEQIFRTPHSIVFHAPSGKLLVGDRGKKSEYYPSSNDGKPGWGNVGPSWERTDGHGRILVVDPHTEEISEFQCPELELGAHKPPLALDTFQGEQDLLFITVGGYNKDANGWSDEAAIYIVDVAFRGDGLGCGQILQHMPIDPELCDVMHDLKIDRQTGDAYISCPGCNGENVMRIRPLPTQLVV